MGVSDRQAAWDALTGGGPGRLTAGRRMGETLAPRQAQGRWNWALGTGPSPAHTWGGRQGQGCGCGKDQSPAALPFSIIKRRGAQRLDLTELARCPWAGCVHL